MEIRKAEKTEFQDVRLFYHSLIDAMQAEPYHPKWRKDVYPSPEELLEAIAEQTLFLGFDGGSIAAAMVINRKCSAEYEDAAWSESLRPDEFLVIHMLGVHSAFHGKGYAKELVRYAIGQAEAAGLKAVRLDVLEGNLPAERLYEGLGFRCVDTCLLFYEDTGRMKFKLYEYRVRPAV